MSPPRKDIRMKLSLTERRIKPSGADFAVIGAVVFIAIAIALWLLISNPGRERYVVVEQDGRVIKSFDLDSVSGEFIIEVGGKYHNVILVEDGRLGFVKSDCPNQYCVHTGMISESGQTAVCLPNRVMIHIYGSPGEADADAVTG